jgi:hypothetical protein
MTTAQYGNKTCDPHVSQRGQIPQRKTHFEPQIGFVPRAGLCLGETANSQIQNQLSSEPQFEIGFVSTYSHPPPPRLYPATDQNEPIMLQ